MSEFRFRIPPQWKLSSHHISSIFVVGLDGIPWPCKVKVDRDSESANQGPLVHVARNRDESGRVYFIYELPDQGEMLLCTGTLPVQEIPYDLLKELARGTLNRLRNQLSIWQEGGLIIPESLNVTVADSVHRLAAAIMCESKVEQDTLAADSIQLAATAIFELAKAFGDQISRYRRENEELGSFWMANSAGCDGQLKPSIESDSFDLVQFSERCLENCKPVVCLDKIDKRLVVGPWLDASMGGMSKALLAEDDHLGRRSILLKDCRTRLEKLPDQAALIHLVGGLNGIGHRHLSYPQQLQLTVDLLQLADQAMIELPVMVSFDFPWAERLAGAVGGIHPLQIADSLLRQGVRISYFGLEINLDYWPNGSVIRDPLQWIDMIDVWSQLDLPLVLCLRVPSGGFPVGNDVPIDRLINHQRSKTSEQQRIDLLNTVLPMMVARPTVHGIIWQQWQDGDDPRFPHGGLVDANGAEKPIAAVIQNLRDVIGS